MNIRIDKQNFPFIILPISLILIIYLPFIFKGGLIIDDWGILKQIYDYPNFMNNFLSWFPLFSNRPLAPLYITTTSWLFQQSAIGYILLNISLWIITSFIIAVVLKKYISKNSIVLFFILAIVPTISSTLIFSPGMQFLGTISIFEWALSFWCLQKYLLTLKKRYYYFSYFIIFIAFLTYEALLPLLTFNLLIPYIHLYPRTKSEYFQYFNKYILPILLILFVIFFMQKKLSHYILLFILV